MNIFTVSRRACLCASLFFGATAFAAAQSPEGPQIPAPDTQIGHVHGEIRLDQYLATNTFRYQGEYEAESNLFAVAGSPVYVFGDVDVEALNGHGEFTPRRLTGTFEGGVRQLFGAQPLSVLIRHQSAHYIDVENLYQGSWNMLAVRWQQQVGRTLLTGTVGEYFDDHQLAASYDQDVDLQAENTFGSVRGHRLFVRADLHGATASGGGSYVDYWIEPSAALGPELNVFVGYGQIHDTNFSASNVDHPLMVGARFIY